MQRLLVTAVVVTAACRLDPLVDDQPGASANVLPADTPILLVTSKPELLNQLTLNDTLDDMALMMSGNVITRSSGWSNGAPVFYWSFGPATRAPAPMYLFGTGDADQAFQQLPLTKHLPLVDAMPGDGEYSPLHTIYRVVVTDRYRGELITTTAALADAIELGLVNAPVATHSFVTSPIVRPGLKLEVGGVAGPAAPAQLYAHGCVMDYFPLGGASSVQPDPFGLLPIRQVSFVRPQTGGAYNRAVFQATIAMAQSPASYTPLSTVVDVDLTMMADINNIKSDDNLFVRSPMTGAIMSTRPEVALFNITGQALVLQLQFVEGSP